MFRIYMIISSFFVYLYHKKQDMDTDELRQFIVQKRELLSRETFSRRAFNRCENMSDEMKTDMWNTLSSVWRTLSWITGR